MRLEEKGASSSRNRRRRKGVAAGNYKGYPDPSRVVSVDEASGLAGKKVVLFVDTRNYWKYAEGHIPGAINLELYAFHWVDTSPAGLEAFAREMATLLGAFGIDNDSQVIFYENDSGYDAARGVWLLEWMGGRRARLLDGGLNLWRRRGLALSTKDAEFSRTRFVPRLNGNAVATLDELSARAKRENAAVIDARSQGEYSGSRRRALKVGHIPGALNIEWKRAVRRDGTLKSAKQLQEIYQGISSGDELVTYCQSGYRAAHSWLVLKLLGFENVRNYIGSWYEWGSAPSTPVVK
jgi:thiosulfate/3-mercaptopyruvate sulfurtransferase